MLGVRSVFEPQGVHVKIHKSLKQQLEREGWSEEKITAFWRYHQEINVFNFTDDSITMADQFDTKWNAKHPLSSNMDDT